MSTPSPMDYQITDVHGDQYIWPGADPASIGSVFQWGDPSAMTLLHCRNDVFVNIAHVVSMKPAVTTQS